MNTDVSQAAQAPSFIQMPVWDIGPKYTYIREIGVGTYGTVCEASVMGSKQRVAIKKFSGIFNDPILCQRILREVEILYSLNHPFIVRPLDLIIKTDASDIYLVLEMAQSDIRKLCKSPVYLERRQVKVLMYRMLVALNYLHSCGIVHRDLKPGNILINSDCTLKICDFSLSRSITGLKSSLFDCDMAIRHNPLLCMSSNSSSNSLSTPRLVVEDEMDEGVESKKTVHCSFAVNFQKGGIPSDARLETEAAARRKPKISGNDDTSSTAGSPQMQCHTMADCDALPSIALVPREDKKRRTGVTEKKIEERQILLCKCKESISAFKRELTGHVGTRWYRSPEIILLEKVYSTAVDMWAVGCVFSELLGMVKDNLPDYKSRRALFPGASCFPLSPSHNPTMNIAGLPISPRDQLNVIVGTKGTPEETELSFVNDPKAGNYLRGLPRAPKREMSKMFPKEDAYTMDLMEKMLEFNPYFRITAKEALRHKYFADVRDKRLEYECEQQISLLSDTYKEGDSVEHLANVVLSKILCGK